MLTETIYQKNNDQDLKDGIALVLKADYTGDWKPIPEWLARNPGLAEQLADFLAAHRGIARETPRRQSQARTGSFVGGLELQEEIGRGAMGVVYKAFDKVLNRGVAVKMIRTGDLPSVVESSRFRFEAEVAASLDHENILPIFSFGESNGDPFLVMPLMAGGTLGDLLNSRQPDRKCDPKEAAELMIGISEGIHHAHLRGLIHRDLKPGNILLDKNGVPQIADFGLARYVCVTVSMVGSIAGTAAYMAPEQARGEAGLTTSVDVHALGAILFELLTGRTPFGGGDLASVLRRVIENQAPPVRQFRPETDKDLEAICLKCLEKRPEDRYPNAQEVAKDLRRYLNGEAVKACPPGFWDWIRQLARTWPEPNPHYSWSVTVWFGVILLTMNLVIYGLVRAEAPGIAVWLTNTVGAAAMITVLWWKMLRKFRLLPVTERHTLIIAAGGNAANLALTFAYVPLSFSASARTALDMYPALAAVSGMGWFVLGSTNWSRFFPVGLGFIALAPVLSWEPDAAPLIYGAAMAALMWYWAYVKKVMFVLPATASETP